MSPDTQKGGKARHPASESASQQMAALRCPIGRGGTGTGGSSVLSSTTDLNGRSTMVARRPGRTVVSVDARQNAVMGHRFCVVGNSGSGKTHLATRLAARLDLPHVELDALNHRAGWQEAPIEEFRAQVKATLDGFEAANGGWVVDGNYRSRIADLVNADTYVWLDYPRSVVARRIVRRSLGRVLMRRELWNGNREQWRSLIKLDPRENILLWSWTEHDSYRKKYEETSASDRHATWIRLRTPQAAAQWLSDVGEHLT
jgi:adenylate kinase family enzyme